MAVLKNAYFISYNWPMIERFICHGTWPLPSHVLNAHCYFGNLRLFYLIVKPLQSSLFAA